MLTLRHLKVHLNNTSCVAHHAVTRFAQDWVLISSNLVTMSLQNVEILSDDDTLLLDPKPEKKVKDMEPRAKASPKKRSKAEAKPKGKAKATAKGSPKKKIQKKKPATMKRPAASSVRNADDGGEDDSGGAEDPGRGDGAAQAMKKPAGKKELGLSVGKSMYKRDGVWSIKMNKKEVIRVPWFHLR